MNKINNTIITNKTISAMFEEQVQGTPNEIALIFKGTSLTYKELNEKVNKLAHYLLQKGVGPDSIVGIMLESSQEMLVAVLGIMKACGTYLAIDPEYSKERIVSMLEESGVQLLLTEERIIKGIPFNLIQNVKYCTMKPIETCQRAQIIDFDSLIIPDRSLVDYDKYSNYIGLAMAKNTVTIQATRGCLYNCTYCHKIWPKKHVVRTAENIFNEIKIYYEIGFRRFVFVDDIFNLDRENSERFFNLIIDKGLKIQIFFPNGLRGDLLTKDYIDLMVKAGVVSFALALETASPRIQKLIQKNVNLDKLRNIIDYITTKHPQLILELFTMHGFPSESEEEANMTLNFIKSTKWIHFPYIHILKVCPGSDMEKLALKEGVSKEEIERSVGLSYQELPDTLPFSKSFTRKYQSDFLNEYFLSKERLLEVLPYQMKVLREDELICKYNSYLPIEINKFSDLLDFVGIRREELGKAQFISEDYGKVTNYNEKVKKYFKKKQPDKDALRILFLDLSQLFSEEGNKTIYNVVEPPLGHMYLMTYLNQKYGEKVTGKLVKSMIDFDNYDELKILIDEFKPDVIAIRTLSFYRDFFHRTVAVIRQWGINTPIITGGPYATSSCINVLKDRNIDLVIKGEGEHTLAELIGKMLENGNKLPEEDTLKKINGIAFVENKHKLIQKNFDREILMLDIMDEILEKECIEENIKLNIDDNLLYKSLNLYNRKISDAIKIKYKDFEAWKDNFLKSREVKKQEEYWVNIFNTEIPVLNLPYDYEGSAIESFESDIVSIELDKKDTEDLRRLAKETGTTLHMVLLSAFTILLSKYSKQEDIVVGTPIAARVYENLNNNMNRNVNILAMRNYPKGDKSYLEFLIEVKENALKAYENQDYQFQELIKKLDLTIYAGRNPLFDVMFVMHNKNKNAISIKEFKLEPYKIDNETLKFDLLLSAVELENNIQLNLEYYTKLFQKETIERMVKQYKNILKVVAEERLMKLNRIPNIMYEEKEKILNEFNNTKSEYTNNKTIQQLFEEQVKKTPNNIAVSSENDTITYHELNNKANRLARVLRNKGVKRDTIVGLMMEKSIDMIIGIIAIWKAGGACLTINALYPNNRIEYMIQDSNVEIVLTERNLSDKCNSNKDRLIIDIQSENIFSEKDDNLNIVNKIEDLLYVVYTSGTTGNPKGVMIPHRVLKNLVNYEHTKTNINFNEKVLQFTNISFDVFFQEMTSTLLSGGELCIISEEKKSDIVELFKFINEKQIKVVFLPTALLKVISSDNGYCEKIPKCISHIITAGEELIVSEALKCYLEKNNVALHNHYGPSETHVVTTYTLMSSDKQILSKPPIGKPIDNTKIYIVDKEQNLQPIGVPGELCIAGESLAKGYINNIELTKDKFVDNPFEVDKKMYKTGDLAKWMPDGNIEFLGRIDNQVKIRGYRIELQEIEKHLEKCDFVKSALVITCKDTYEDKVMVGFIINDNSYRDKSKEELEKRCYDYLKKNIPAYMIPKRILIIEKFPTTFNGKIDKSELEKIFINSSINKEINKKLSNNIEEILMNIWKDVLGKDNFGSCENFFDIGGNSILSTVLIKKINEHFKKNVNTIELFKNPTIDKMAKFLKGYENEITNNTSVNDDKNLKLNLDYEEDIAVVGMSCRFPHSNSITEFWNNLLENKNLIDKFELSQDDEDYKGFAGYLNNIEYFDANFFGISEKEAKLLDPQYRFFMECVWEAFEDSGYNPYKYQGRVGVFAGSGANTYLINNIFSNMKSESNLVSTMEDLQILYNNNKDFIANRVSYIMNFTGPSINVQTACSTSLVAVHLACQSIKNKECELAVAGVSTILIPQKKGYKYSEDMVFSPDGKCRAFDENASGTVFSDGVGVILLKTLKQAKKDNDNIYAVIKASSINNDGSNKVGFTAPSVEGQKRVIKDALMKSNINPETIQYLEAHGTGTKIGDIVEVTALKEAYDTKKKNYCALGSVKTNLGHTSWTSGMAGIIKLCLSLKNKKMLPHNSFEKLNSDLKLEESPFYINEKLKNWEKADSPRRGAISAFGIGGTNAHIILEEVEVNNSNISKPKRSAYCLTFSGKNQQAVKELQLKYKDDIDSICENNIDDICFTNNVGRNHFNYRSILLFNSIEDLKNKLNTISKAKNTYFKIYNTENTSKNKTAFMFSGNGNQYANMGKEFYDTNLDFRNSMNYCNDIFLEYTGISLLEIIYSDKENNLINDIMISQIAIFSVEISLAVMWEKIGIKPEVVFGHSLGEYSAACYAGIFNIDECMKILIKRGQILKELGSDFEMVSIRTNRKSIEKIINDNQIKIAIAAINSELSYVLTGTKAEITKLCEVLEDSEFEYKKLNINVAGHSKELLVCLPKFKKVFDDIKFKEPKIKIYSTVNWNFFGDEFLTVDYWCKHLVEAVNFEKAVRKVNGLGVNTFIEIGPSHTLLGFTMECLPEYEGNRISSLKRNRGNWEHLLDNMKKLYLSGYNIDWNVIYYDGKKINLPKYQFQRKKYWIDSNFKSYKDNKLDGGNSWREWLYNFDWEEKKLNLQNNYEDYCSNKEKWLVFCKNEKELNIIKNISNELNYEVIIVVRGNENKKLSDNVVSLNLDQGETIDYLLNNLLYESYKVMYFYNNYNNDIIYGNNVKFKSIVNDFMYIAKIIKIITEKNICKKLYFTSLNLNEKSSTKEISNDMILAISRVIEMENSHLEIKRLIFNCNSVKEFKELLNIEIKNNKSDDYVLYSNGIRKTLRIKNHLFIENNKTFEIEKDGIYIITGGTGGIGKTVVKWLTKYEVKHIIILSRREPSEEVISELNKDKEKNTKIEFIKLDITDNEKLEQLFIEINKEKTILKGIFHCAGVIKDSIVNEMTHKELESVLKPKILGTWNLHTLTKKYFKDLNLFVLFSTTAAFTGNAGQASHAIANAFMDSLVKLRNNEGLKCTSINWGAWSEIGYLSTRKEVLKKYNRKGYEGITSVEGLKSLEYIIKNKINNIAVLPINWDKFIEYHNLSNRSMYNYIKGNKEKDIQENDVKDYLKEICNLEVSEREKYLREYLLLLVEETIGAKLSLKDDQLKSFFELGMDSLSAIEIRNKIQRDYRIKLSANFAYENKYIDACVKKILEELNKVDLKKNINHENRIIKEEKGNKELRNISCQQKRWLRLIELQYGERVVPIKYKHKLDKEAFIYALKKVLERHESLRWYFPDNKIKQLKIDEIIKLNENLFIEVQGLNEEERIDKITSLIKYLFKNMPSPTVKPSWMIKCLNYKQNEFTILLCVQHLDFDGSSLTVFANEFNEFYMQYLFNKPLNLKKQVVQYSEYIEWQQDYIKNHIGEDRQFFKGLYGTMRKMTILPGKAGYKIGTPRLAAKYCAPIVDGLWRKISEVSIKRGVSSFSIILAAYSIFLSKLVNSSEVVIATIMNGRSKERFKNTIGPFTAPFPIRVWIGDLAVEDIVEQCNLEVLEINSRAYYPVEDLINNIQAFKELPCETYFSDAGINFTNYKGKIEKSNKDYEVIEVLGSIEEKEFKVFNDIKFKRMPGLHLVVNQVEEGVTFNFYYHIGRFRKDEVKAWSDEFHLILNDMIIKLL